MQKIRYNSASGKRGKLRIIGGEWRGRKLDFLAVEGLRPTTDRIRETLFNWLQPSIVGASCLDLFAGSGALGFEAASRGASVEMVELHPQVVSQLEKHIHQLSPQTISLWHGSALSYLEQSGRAFDIIFLDPPFASGLMRESLLRLANGKCLKAQGLCYLEFPAEHAPELPGGWHYYRYKQSGAVGYGLIQRF